MFAYVESTENDRQSPEVQQPDSQESEPPTASLVAPTNTIGLPPSSLPGMSLRKYYIATSLSLYIHLFIVTGSKRSFSRIQADGQG